MTSGPRKRGRDRFGRLVFFIPILIVLLLVAFALWSGATGTSGVLMVRAQSASSASTSLPASVSVNGETSTVPFNLTLAQGSYVVTFNPLGWYTAPPPETVVVPAGKTSYAVGVYTPVERVVAISNDGFNQTSITALHGVTPVVWVNEAGSPVVLDVQGVKAVPLEAGQNYTQVFQSAGKFAYSIFNTSEQGRVTVS